MRDNHEIIRTLELQISLNEMLPPTMQCQEAIIKMKRRLAMLRAFDTLGAQIVPFRAESN